LFFDPTSRWTEAMRKKLANRRPNVTRVWEGLQDRYYISFGVDIDEHCAAREVFISGAKIGSDLAVLLDDATVVLSLALQHGVTLDTLIHSLSATDHTEPPDGRRSVLAAAVGLMADERRRLNGAAGPSKPANPPSSSKALAAAAAGS